VGGEALGANVPGPLRPGIQQDMLSLQQGDNSLKFSKNSVSESSEEKNIVESIDKKSKCIIQ